jgi:hypothetical protein
MPVKFFKEGKIVKKEAKEDGLYYKKLLDSIVSSHDPKEGTYSVKIKNSIGESPNWFALNADSVEALEEFFHKYIKGNWGNKNESIKFKEDSIIFNGKPSGEVSIIQRMKTEGESKISVWVNGGNAYEFTTSKEIPIEVAHKYMGRSSEFAVKLAEKVAKFITKEIQEEFKDY